MAHSDDENEKLQGTLLCLGDSVIDNKRAIRLSIGEKHIGVTGHLRERIEHVVNFSRTGSTMAMVSKRVDSVMAPHVQKTHTRQIDKANDQYRAVVLSIGGNDIAVSFGQSFSALLNTVLEFERNFCTILQEIVDKYEVPVLVIGIPKVRLSYAADCLICYCNGKIKNAITSVNASRTEEAIISFYDIYEHLGTEFLVRDNIHINDEGSIIIADQISRFFKKTPTWDTERS